MARVPGSITLCYKVEGGPGGVCSACRCAQSALTATHAHLHAYPCSGMNRACRGSHMQSVQVCGRAACPACRGYLAPVGVQVCVPCSGSRGPRGRGVQVCLSRHVYTLCIQWSDCFFATRAASLGPRPDARRGGHVSTEARIAHLHVYPLHVWHVCSPRPASSALFDPRPAATPTRGAAAPSPSSRSPLFGLRLPALREATTRGPTAGLLPP